MSEAKVYNNVASEENVQVTLLEQLVESRLENKMERGFNRILREMQVNNAEIKNEIDKLDRKIDKVETELSAKIDKVDSKIDKVETDLSAKIDKVEVGLNAKIDKVETELKSEIKRVEGDLSAKVDKVDNKVFKANFLSTTAFTLIGLIIGAIISWVINNHLKMN